MANPVIRATAQAVLASNTVITVNVPTGTVDGDQLVVFVHGDQATGAWAANESGWDELQDINTGSQSTLAAYRRTVSGTPPSSYGFTITSAAGNDNLQAVAITVNPNGTTYDTVVSSATSALVTTTGTTGAVTGTAAPSVLLCGFGADDNRTVATPPAGMTLAEFVDGDSSELATYTEVNPGTGSLTRSVVWSSSTDTLQIAALLSFIAPAPPPASGHIRLLFRAP